MPVLTSDPAAESGGCPEVRIQPPPCTDSPPALYNWSISTAALVVPVLKHHGSCSPRPTRTKAPVRQTAIQPSIRPGAIVYVFTQLMTERRRRGLTQPSI